MHDSNRRKLERECHTQPTIHVILCIAKLLKVSPSFSPKQGSGVVTELKHTSVVVF